MTIYYPIKKRRQDVVDSDLVEEFRESVGYNHGEMAALLNLSRTQYDTCRRKGKFLGHRFHAAKAAMLEAVAARATKELNRIVQIGNSGSIDE